MFLFNPVSRPLNVDPRPIPNKLKVFMKIKSLKPVLKQDVQNKKVKNGRASELTPRTSCSNLYGRSSDISKKNVNRVS